MGRPYGRPYGQDIQSDDFLRKSRATYIPHNGFFNQLVSSRTSIAMISTMISKTTLSNNAPSTADSYMYAGMCRQTTEVEFSKIGVATKSSSPKLF